jgi:hypothetical protein
MKCEIKLSLLLIIDHIKSVFKTLLHHPLYVSLGSFVKFLDECFRTYANASYDDMGIFLFVILCKHGVYT